ncbi:unnamed protein product [Toxocara canis]|uniref:Cation_ATPase_N domain-containing protein n=1 Tax=Toxocara canis TaxID=6265 RepID=A0A183U5R3_TOXCA|nr:unnamed protein product [Toxocara canis]
MLDAESKHRPADTPFNECQRTDAFRASVKKSSNESQTGTAVDRLILWLSEQSRETLITLFICTVIIYAMGMADA